MGLKLIFLSKFYVWINNKSLLIPRDHEFLVICEADGLHSCFTVNGILVCKHELWLRLPFEDFTLGCSRYKVLSILNPLYRKKRLSGLVLALSNKLRCSQLPVRTGVGEMIREVILCEGVVRKNRGSVSLIEVEGRVLLVVAFRCVQVVPLRFFLLRRSQGLLS